LTPMQLRMILREVKASHSFSIKEDPLVDAKNVVVLQFHEGIVYAMEVDRDVLIQAV
jgi:hypothetical protein